MNAWLVRRAVCAALMLAASGCGDDDEGAPPATQPARPTAAATPGAAAGGPGPPKNMLPEKLHIEDRVACPIPEQPSDPRGGKCDPKAPSCAEHLYCLPLAQGSYCEPCPERDGIRHAFRERDFDVEHNRDPFQSLVLPVGPIPGAAPALSKKCPREDQLVATGYSYADLKLVGIVAEGTQRKVLMMGGPLGYIIKRGDCVGKEKAVVKDIGLGYVTFQVDPDEYSVQLNPKQLMVSDPELPRAAPRTTITPVAPSSAPAPRTTITPVAPSSAPAPVRGAGGVQGAADGGPAGAGRAAAGAASGTVGAPGRSSGALGVAAGGAPAPGSGAGSAPRAPAAPPPTRP